MAYIIIYNEKTSFFFLHNVRHSFLYDVFNRHIYLIKYSNLISRVVYEKLESRVIRTALTKIYVSRSTRDLKLCVLYLHLDEII